MPRKERQKAKIIALLEIFQQQTDENHRLTVPMLEQQLAARDIPSERKSIYTDIAALQEIGYQIELARGPGGGYYMEHRAFELAELEILVDAVQNSRFITPKKSAQLIKKLSSLASKYQAQQLSRQVFVSGRVKSGNESLYYNVDAIHRAILENRKVRFTYWRHSFAKRKIPRVPRTVYDVSPFALVWENSNYYLLAYQTYAEPHGIRHYRVDKMTTVNITAKPRVGQDVFDQFDIAGYTNKMFGMYGGKDVRVTLRCENYYIDAMVDRFGMDFIPIKEKNGTHFHFDVTVSVSPQFFGWVCGFAGGVEIVAPTAVATQMKEHLQNLATAYQTQEEVE